MSVDLLEYEELKSPMSSQGTSPSKVCWTGAGLGSLLDRIYEEGLDLVG